MLEKLKNLLPKKQEPNKNQDGPRKPNPTLPPPPVQEESNTRSSQKPTLAPQPPRKPFPSGSTEGVEAYIAFANTNDVSNAFSVLRHAGFSPKMKPRRKFENTNASCSVFVGTKVEIQEMHKVLVEKQARNQGVTYL